MSSFLDVLSVKTSSLKWGFQMGFAYYMPKDFNGFLILSDTCSFSQHHT